MFKYLLLLSILIFGCGGSDGGPDTDPVPRPCTVLVDGVLVTVDCSERVPCDRDRDCEDGTFCLNGFCASACSVDEHCAIDSTCNVRGRCVPPYGTGGTGGTGVCQDVEVTPSRIVPRVVFLVDQSGSMRDPFGNQTRWSASQFAITVVVEPLDSIVDFSLFSYVSNDGFERGDTCPLFPLGSNPVLRNEEILDETLFSPDYDGSYGNDTPTGEALTELAFLLSQSPPPGDGPLYIVLATDGMPDSCEDPDGHNSYAESLSVDAADYALSLGIQTLVLSVGPEVRDDHLQALADAGTGVAGSEWWRGTNPEDLALDFVDIVRASIPCDVELEETIIDEEAACADGIAFLGGTEIFCDADWIIKDPNTLELVGDACDVFKDGFETFSAELPCGSVIVE